MPRADRRPHRHVARPVGALLRPGKRGWRPLRTPATQRSRDSRRFLTLLVHLPDGGRAAGAHAAGGVETRAVDGGVRKAPLQARAARLWRLAAQDLLGQPRALTAAAAAALLWHRLGHGHVRPASGSAAVIAALPFCGRVMARRDCGRLMLARARRTCAQTRARHDGDTVLLGLSSYIRLQPTRRPPG